MTAALASQDPLTVGTSARIVTHTLASSGHLPAAITTARNYSLRLDRQTGTHTPESLSVYKARCCSAVPSLPPTMTTPTPTR